MENKTDDLYKGKFVTLKQMNTDNFKYEYLHEHRCDGNIVSILPVQYDRGILLRQEYTPCWGDDLCLSSITGGWEKNRHETPIDAVIEELEEEAGIILHDETRIMTLGTCRGTKSSDSLYHLFLVDLTHDYPDPPVYSEVTPTTDGGYLEGQEHCEWVVGAEWMEKAVDPLLFVMYTRWRTAQLHREASRNDYR